MRQIGQIDWSAEDSNSSNSSNSSNYSKAKLEFSSSLALNAWLTASLKALAQGAPIDRLRLMEIIHDRLEADPLSIDRPHRDWYCRTLDRWLRRGLPLHPTTSRPDPRAADLLRRARYNFEF